MESTMHEIISDLPFSGEEGWEYHRMRILSQAFFVAHHIIYFNLNNPYVSEYSRHPWLLNIFEHTLGLDSFHILSPVLSRFDNTVIKWDSSLGCKDG